jgi:hypothetical protein
VLALTYYPLVKAYTLGQIQVWLDAGFALLFCCWLAGRERLAGVLAALLCLVKPQHAVLLLWGALRRRWGFVCAAAATGAAGLAASVALFGAADHVEYLSVLASISRHGEAFQANQSVNGLLHRLLGNGGNLDWQFLAFAPYHPAVCAGTLVSSLALLAAALFGAARGRGSAADLAFVALAATVASPVAWEHHYGILLPLYAYLLPRLASRPVLGRATLPLLGLSYLLTGQQFACTARLAQTPLNFAQSHVLAGALLLLPLLHRLRAAPAGEAAVLPTPEVRQAA